MRIPNSLCGQYYTEEMEAAETTSNPPYNVLNDPCVGWAPSYDVIQDAYWSFNQSFDPNHPDLVEDSDVCNYSCYTSI